MRTVTITNLPGKAGGSISKLPPDVHNAVLNEFARQSSLTHWPQTTIIIAFVLMLIVLYQAILDPWLGRLLSPMLGPMASQFVVSGIIGVAASGLLVLWAFRMSKGVTISNVLKFNHCPSCGYHLERAKPDPVDGCTVCPECGAAWKLSPPQHQ